MESVERALDVLRVVAESGALRLSDISRVLGLPHSSVHRLLATLERRGYVARAHGRSRLYIPGPALVDLGASVADVTFPAAEPALRALAETCGETAHLITLRNTTAYFIGGIESRRALRVGLRVGSTLPAHCSSGGKALLALLSPVTLEIMYPDERLPAVTDRSTTDRTTLFAELDAIRERGYAVNEAESEDDIRAIGAAVIDGHGRPRGALAIAAPNNRLPDDDIPYIAAQIVGAAGQVGAALGR
ncbi:IclR family transcriptional regulator [Streptomyces sp. SID3343]|uniref:IclR family transcriptional regulator n=1 Tax=Streptomyces sp. SID3343 TaxID=2690260 RepID=UPI0013C0D775|nr:helix-turn-helix domain-containing protein [Streptomyces sp. SID3343]